MPSVGPVASLSYSKPWVVIFMRAKHGVSSASGPVALAGWRPPPVHLVWATAFSITQSTVTFEPQALTEVAHRRKAESERTWNAAGFTSGAVVFSRSRSCWVAGLSLASSNGYVFAIAQLFFGNGVALAA